MKLTSNLLLTATAMCAGSAYAQQTRPNIILILADDMGYGDISALNENSRIHTPHIDELASRGIIFTDAHSNSAVSTPSRYGIMTGRYAFRTRLKQWTPAGYDPPLIDSRRSTVASMLRSQGYTTACIGKWHLGWNWAREQDGKNVDYSKPITEGPTTRGFDYFFGLSASLDMPPYVYVENEMPTAIPNRIAADKGGVLLQRSGPQGPDFEHEDCLPNFWKRSLDYIRSREESETPFFLYIPLTAPHTPILPTAEFRGSSGLSPYGDFCVMIDHLVGEMTALLRSNGMLDNTMVIFTSDNGCAPYAGMDEMMAQGHYSSYVYRGSKSDLFDGGHRIPLIVSWGDKYDGIVEDGIISLTDFYATFAQMTGYRLPENEAEDSYSMWPVLARTGKSERDHVISHSGDGSFAIREGDWKLLFCGGSGGWSEPHNNDQETMASLPPVQLYDLRSDVGETSNLEAEYRERIRQMTLTMRRYLLEGRSTPGPAQPNDTGTNWPQTRLFMEK